MKKGIVIFVSVVAAIITAVVLLKKTVFRKKYGNVPVKEEPEFDPDDFAGDEFAE